MNADGTGLGDGGVASTTLPDTPGYGDPQDYGEQTGQDQTPTEANSADEYGQESCVDDDAQSAERSEAEPLMAQAFEALCARFSTR